MILADTSVWIDHLRRGEAELTTLLNQARVLVHPAVIGELALGQLSQRAEILDLLSNLPQATRPTEGEVLSLIETHRLFGRGIGYLDAHLLAATLLTADARLWTRDKRLASAASDLQVEFAPGT